MITCLECRTEIRQSMCAPCAVRLMREDIEGAVIARLMELEELSQIIILGEAYQGEIRAYTKVLSIIKDL